MLTLRFMGRALVGASLLVAAGVAVNQVYGDGRLSWSWGYLALIFTVLGAMVQTAPQAAAAPPDSASSSSRTRRSRPRGSRREYLRRMRSTVEQMETIGLVTQAEFVLRTRQVYVDVVLRPRPVTDVLIDTGMGPVPSTGGGRRASLASFLAEGRVLAVLGAAGSGKTTLARYTALEMAEHRRLGRRRRSWLPVLLYLRDHAEELQGEEPQGLARIAAAAPWLNGIVSDEWLEQRLARGRCVVLLDGLDEVADPRDRRRLVHWVENQISRYPDNAFVVTSRPLGYDGNRLSRADVLQVQRFTSRQIHDFLHAWYRAIEHRSRQGDAGEIDRTARQQADDLFQRISGRPALSDLAANPLLLTMIANVHRYRSSLPGSRVALYEEVCQVLLHRRQEAKKLADTDLNGLSGDKKERVVQELAWYMMRQKLRDIPGEEAERAIRTVLQRTAPDIAPGTFLSHVKRSGLLLEHQYQRYGFAHLTLQEYLAASLVPGYPSRRQLLVKNVSDPWWRETTLLWAARADASDIVEACLEARTVTALNLAYACAAEARELDPALRDRLDQLLATTPEDPDEVRLLDGVAAARALQDTRVLDDTGTRICTRPVPDDLWNRYTAHTGNDLAAPGPAAGLWTDELKRFVTWLNGLFGDGTSYRLPTPAEAGHALSGDLHPSPGTVLYAAEGDWAGDSGYAALITVTEAGHPHRPTPQQIRIYSDLILDHTHVVFRLIHPFSTLTFTQLAVFAGGRDLTTHEGRLLHTVDLALELAFLREPAHELAADRIMESARDLDLDLGLDTADGGEHATYRALVRVLDHARDLNRQLDVKVAEEREFVPVRVSDLIRILGVLLARDVQRRGLDAFDAMLFSEQGDPGPAPPDELNRALDRALDHTLGLVRDHDPAYSDDFVPTRDLPPALARARRGDGLEPASVRHLVLARDLILAQARAIARPQRALDPATAIVAARDLAFARAVASSDLGSWGIDAVVGTGEACMQLMRGFAGFSPRDSVNSLRHRREEAGPSLESFLHVSMSAVARAVPADDPARTLARARSIARDKDMAAVETMIENAMRLAAPLWDRSRQVRQSDMVLAATSILAALTHVKGRAEEPSLTGLLHSALSTIIALTPESLTAFDDTIHSSRLLVLVRA
ncbi:NACHT domain-containing protein [Actinomadura luteofluorescens]|uniref:NACHT domain-containing protein n=1 Tax=Actinomadura luteofluorescens TaxID=46163 RepID=UPI003498A8BB